MYVYVYECICCVCVYTCLSPLDTMCIQRICIIYCYIYTQDAVKCTEKRRDNILVEFQIVLSLKERCLTNVFVFFFLNYFLTLISKIFRIFFQWGYWNFIIHQGSIINYYHEHKSTFFELNRNFCNLVSLIKLNRISRNWNINWNIIKQKLIIYFYFHC